MRTIIIRTNKDIEEWNKDQRNGDTLILSMIEPLRTAIWTDKRVKIAGDTTMPKIE